MATTTITIPVPGSRARWLAVGLAGGILVAAIASPAFAPRTILGVDGTGTPPEHVISVTGTGRVVISPDVADLRVGVGVNRPTVKAAREAAAASMSKVVAALKKLGIADADIQTTILSLQPVYDYSTNTNPPRLTGYQLQNAVAVTVRNLDTVGDAIDDSLAAGATTFDGVSFRVQDPARAEAQAREAAMAQAKSKAETLAKGAGASLGGVASISETAAPIPWPVYAGRDAAGAAPDKSVATPVEPGTNEVTVTVAVSYLIR
ncbi:MAG: SIMPL domain-containing protein [Chloroflexota bacterium]